MSNLKLTENDAFYNMKFDNDIFLYWMLKWLKVDTTNNSNKKALKNMAKKFVEEILGQKLNTKDIEICYSNFYIGKDYEDFINRILNEYTLLFIVNKKKKSNRKYIFFKCFDYDEFSPYFFEYNQELVQLLKIYENLGNNETDKIKIVYITPDKISRYEKEEIGEKIIMYDEERLLEFFKTFKKDIDDSIFDSYYNQLMREVSEEDYDSFNVSALYSILEWYFDKKRKNYDVYRNDYYIKWIKDEFFVECVYKKNRNREFDILFVLNWFHLDELQEDMFESVQCELKNIFPDFQKIYLEEVDLKEKEVPLFYLKVDKDASVSKIKEILDEITEKIEKFNETRGSLDIKDEYDKYIKDERRKGGIRFW
jgi:hypothetical protein